MLQRHHVRLTVSLLCTSQSKSLRTSPLRCARVGHGSRWETESFLKRVQAYLHYTEDDLERDLTALRAARG